MHIILNHSSMVPIYEQLVEQIKTEILTVETVRRRRHFLRSENCLQSFGSVP